MSELEDKMFSQAANECDTVVREMESLLVSGRTPYQSYSIWRSKTLGLCVTIDGDLQSTELDHATYHEALVHPAMLLCREPRQVLICGGGEGATAFEVLRHPTVERVTMVDIDREFIEACRTHLPQFSKGAFDDERLELRCEDIFGFLDNCDDTYDVIIGDLTDLVEEIAPGLSFHNASFYRSLAKRLNPGGVLATQASQLALFDTVNHRHIRASIIEAFDNATSYRAHHDSFFVPWSFVVAGAGWSLPPAGKLSGLFAERISVRGLELEHFDAESLASCFALNKRIKKLLGQ